MSVYLIYDVDITDPDTYARYKPEAGRSIIAHGGEILVASDKAETIEGSWAPSWLVVIRFPSREQAQTWMDSEDYRPWKKLRQTASTAQAVLAVERGG